MKLAENSWISTIPIQNKAKIGAGPIMSLSTIYSQSFTEINRVGKSHIPYSVQIYQLQLNTYYVTSQGLYASAGIYKCSSILSDWKIF